jgi:sec-independent protein translocase protein TatC
VSHEDIEATKAPLMEHLIELRSRLIKALLAFGAMFVLCFFFSTQIFNVLVWPYTWVAGTDKQMIYTAMLELFFTHRTWWRRRCSSRSAAWWSIFW